MTKEMMLNSTMKPNKNVKYFDSYVANDVIANGNMKITLPVAAPIKKLKLFLSYFNAHHCVREPAFLLVPVAFSILT